MTEVIDSFSGSYSFLSNFYVHEFRFRRQYWPTAEHAFQAAKCVHDRDARAIRAASTPHQAKQLGRMVIERHPDWDWRRNWIMHRVLRGKFRRGTDLALALLRTGDAILIEGNTWGDKYWGQVNGVGQNQLGILLMMRRAELRGVWF